MVQLNGTLGVLIILSLVNGIRELKSEFWRYERITKIVRNWKC